MAENSSGKALRELRSPTRNHYFYGKLLDVTHFQMEQTYFNRKRWLLNRLGLGAGVLCGLEAEADGGGVVVSPGVAIDPLGREIIVPAAVTLENVLEDTEIAEDSPGFLCLCYHECETEMVPVLVSECDTQEDCAPSTIQERYRLEVRADRPAVVQGVCDILFPEDGSYERERVEEALHPSCAPAEGACVVLARVTPGEDGVTVEEEPHRKSLYSNSVLWELIACLAEEVETCCQVRILRYQSGDGQEAEPGEALPEPLVAKVVDADGEAVGGETVTFQVRSGGGSLDAEQVQSDDENGLAQSRWQLGTEGELQTAEAFLDSGSQVVFVALAQVEDGEPAPECIEFEDLEMGATFGVGDTFTSSGVTITGRPFAGRDAELFSDGSARVRDDNRAGGSGQELMLSAVGLSLDFGAPIVELELLFGELGGRLNLAVNGDVRIVESFSELDGGSVGGVNVQVTDGEDQGAGQLQLAGDIYSFLIGGEELAIDHICPGDRREAPEFPVILNLWPPNAGVVLERQRWPDRWPHEPRVALTFDRPMDTDQMEEPEPWLRIFALHDRGEIVVRRLEITLVDESIFPSKETVVYALEQEPEDEAVRYLVLIQADDEDIMSADDPRRLLDADFAGSDLERELLMELWRLEDRHSFGRDIWEALVDTGETLPRSGDGNAGGLFHSWFQLRRENG